MARKGRKTLDPNKQQREGGSVTASVNGRQMATLELITTCTALGKPGSQVSRTNIIGDAITDYIASAPAKLKASGATPKVISMFEERLGELNAEYDQIEAELAAEKVAEATEA